jgi:hypothetical protein
MVMCGDGYLVYRCDPCMPGEDDPDFRHRAALWHMICMRMIVFPVRTQCMFATRFVRNRISR